MIRSSASLSEEIFSISSCNSFSTCLSFRASSSISRVNASISLSNICGLPAAGGAVAGSAPLTDDADGSASLPRCLSSSACLSFSACLFFSACLSFSACLCCSACLSRNFFRVYMTCAARLSSLDATLPCGDAGDASLPRCLSSRLASISRLASLCRLACISRIFFCACITEAAVLTSLDATLPDCLSAARS